MLEPLLEVDEFEIADKERWRCNNVTTAVSGPWGLEVERLIWDLTARTAEEAHFSLRKNL